MPDVRLRGLVVEYRTDSYPIRPIDGLDADVGDGELTLLLGPSGCGKTTLLSCLGGLLRPTEGEVSVGGRDLATMTEEQRLVHRRQGVGFVFQSFNLIPSLTAAENIAAPMRTTGTRRVDALARAHELLDLFGLADRADHRPGELSGGQQQRVAIARGLAQDPPLLLADEPTANLDYVQAESVISLLRELARPGRTIIVSTHDDRLLPIADRVIDLVPDFHGDTTGGEVVLEDGAVLFRQGDRGALVYLVEDGEVEIVTTDDDGVERVIARKGPGEYFGELGPMMAQRRSATARASTPCRLTSMSLQEFRARGRASSSADGRG